MKTFLLFPLLLLVLAISASAATVDLLPSARNDRAAIVDVLTAAKRRTPAIVDSVNALISKRSLVAIDASTFGFLALSAGDNMVSTVAASAVITSNAAVWSVADTGKTIHIQGAGVAGATYVGKILSVSGTSATLNVICSTSVTASKTSSAGIAMWGWPATSVLETIPLLSVDGAYAYQRSLSATYASPDVNAKDYGAIGDGVTDDTASLKSALAAACAINGKLYIPAGIYVTSDKLTPTMAKSVHIQGAGIEKTVLKWTGAGAYSVNGGAVYGQSGTACIFLRVNADTRISDLSITVNQPSGTYVEGQRAIVAASDLVAYRDTGIVIERVGISQIGSAGIMMVFQESFTIRDCVIKNIGYEGIVVISGKKGLIHGNIVDNMTPGVSASMFGIRLSHDTTLWPGDQDVSPFSTDMVVSNNFVENSAWSGIASQGGYRVVYNANYIRNVQAGLGIGRSSGGAAGYSGGQHIITNNYVDAGVYAGNPGSAGINITGGTTDANVQCAVQNNIVKGYGIPSANSGAITAIFVADSIVSDNLIVGWFGCGVYTAGANTRGLTINGNSFTGLGAAGDTVATCINVNENIPGLTISGNSLSVGVTNAPKYGVVAMFQSAANPVTAFGNDFGEATINSFLISGTVRNGGPSAKMIQSSGVTLDVKGLGNAVVIMKYTVPTTIPSIDIKGGIEGQLLTLVCYSGNATVTIDRSNAYLPGGNNFAITSRNSITIVFDGSKWCAVAATTTNN